MYNSRSGWGSVLLWRIELCAAQWENFQRKINLCKIVKLSQICCCLYVLQDKCLVKGWRILGKDMLRHQFENWCFIVKPKFKTQVKTVWGSHLVQQTNFATIRKRSTDKHIHFIRKWMEYCVACPLCTPRLAGPGFPAALLALLSSQHAKYYILI